MGIIRVYTETQYSQQPVLTPDCFECKKQVVVIDCPVTCDHNNTISQKMKYTFCTNYSSHFLVKSRRAAQDFMRAPSFYLSLFLVFPENTSFESFLSGFPRSFFRHFSLFPGKFGHFPTRRFAQSHFLFSESPLSFLSCQYTSPFPCQLLFPPYLATI